MPAGVEFVSATDDGFYNSTKHKVFLKFENPEFSKTVSVTVRESSGEIGTEHKNYAYARFVIDPDD